METTRRIEHTMDDGGQATIAIEGLERELRLLHLTDCHLSEGDGRDELAAEYVTSWQERFGERTPGRVPARQVYDDALDRARAADVDGIALTGDIIHQPTYRAIETIQQSMEGMGKPYIYALGNHDWYFSYLKWTTTTRAEHYPRFGAVTNGNPACQSLVLGGVRLIALDNSTYQVSAEQVALLERELSQGQPCLLFMHIPIWIESLAPAVMDEWQAPILMASPRGWTPELRSQWQVGESEASTMECYELLTAGDAENLAGIFCGHVHFAHADAYREGRYQYITEAGFEGGSRIIHLRPLP